MKVCILSMQKVDNYGSLLQSFALKSMLEEVGNDVSFIDIIPNDIENRVADNKQIYGTEQMFYWSNRKERIKAAINKYFFIRLFHKIEINKRNNIFKKFREEKLGISQEDNNKNYELCVIGSDEVFNGLQNTSWGFTTQLYGNVKNAKKVITYAACCGYTKYDLLNEKEKELISSSFKNISDFSVRDQNTFDFVKDFGYSEKDISINFDPALVYDFSKYIEDIKMKLPKRYCLVYAYKNRIKETEDIKSIKTFCKKNNMKIITMCDDQFWNMDYRAVNPFELLYAIKNAEFVITDTFHGAIFSAKYANKFAIMCKSSNNNKLGDLTGRLDIKNHLIEKYSDLDSKYKDFNDKEKINNKIKSERERTINYLMKNIQ